MAQLLAGPGVSVSNAAFNCAANAIGSFNGSSSLGFNNGLILTSGNTSVASPNTNISYAGNCNNTPGDTELNTLAGSTTYDACALEFDVIPLCDTLKFKYVFGSEEYPEYVPSSPGTGFNDAFAFFISGPGITGQQNIAKIPGTSTDVTIYNVNDHNNSQYYVTNSGSTIEYDGYTTVLTAWCLVQSCQTYHLKIVIADAGDCVFDSGVFLEAGSLQCATVVAATATVQNAIEGCQDGSFEFCRAAPATSAVTINYTIAGSAANGTDYNTIASSITIPAGQLCASLPIIAIDDGIPESTDSILIIYQPGPCPTLDTVTIYITDGELDAGPDTTYCTGDNVVIGIPPVAGFTYSWAPATGLSNATVSNPTVTLTNSGTTSIITNYVLTATTSGCTLKDTVAVTVNPLSVANAGPNQVVCSGPVQLAGTMGGGFTGMWSGGAGTYSPNDTTLNSAYTPSATELHNGTVTLTLTALGLSGTCPSATDQITITFPPQVVDAGPDITFCSGDTSIIGPAPITGTAYSWTPAMGLSSATNSNTTITLTDTGTTSIVTNYVLTATTNGCPVSDTVVVTVNPIPVVDAGPDQTICGGSVLLAGSISGGASVATWSGGVGTFNPGNTNVSSTYNLTPTEMATGSITLTLTSNDPPGTCPSVADQVVITVTTLASVSAGPDQTICMGNSATLNGSYAGTANGGLWTGGSGIYTPDNTSPNATYVPSTDEMTVGTVTLIFSAFDSTSSCAPVTDQITITIDQQPTANAGSTQYICSGDNITLSGTIGGSAVTGTWSGGTGAFSPDNTTLNATYTPSAAEYATSSVTLTLTTDDPSGPCTFSSSDVTFYFYEKPVVNFTADIAAGCPIHCTNFTNTSAMGGGDSIVSWNWNFGDDGPGSVSANPAYCFSISGYYDIELTATSNNGCSSTLMQTHLVEVYAVPDAEFSASPNPTTMIEPLISFNNESSADVNYWNWNFGDGDLLAPNTANPTHEYYGDSVGNYMVTLIVRNTNGCYDTVQHQIIIGPAFTFYIPNAFTPNNDGKNDTFYGSGTGIEKYDMRIFDRWGDMIFHTKDITIPWDGKANDGKTTAQMDVFVWKVVITDALNKKHNYVGTVTLSR